MRPDAERRRKAFALLAEVFRIRQQLGRKHAVFDDFLIVVQIVDKQVQRMHALLEPGRNLIPFLLGDHSRNQIERHRPIDARIFEVHTKRDASHECGYLTGGLAFVQFIAIQALEIFPDRTRCRTRPTACTDQLVMEAG